MIKVVDSGPVRVISLDRHEKRNALSQELCTLLIDGILHPPSSTRAIVLTGEGTVFSAGADLDETDFQDALYPVIAKLMRTIVASPLPAVAYLNGPAIGAGMMLAMACDLRVVSETAVCSLPVTKIGIGVDSWPVEALTELIGGARARAMLLAGLPLDVDTAVATGFAVGRGSLEDALALAGNFAGKSAETVANVKQQFAPSLFTEAERDAGVQAAWGARR
ncbi:putative enoyl-CoA hydratase echA6 [Corynebacterium glaucum]|uniref:enoyl-CoA hydratase-related protein n=1 Tax=Corynebacterium glaucum TaxID=187491 RepID=UPI0025B5512D|nr:enoyl-CoA hydratase-related protein [Corynebacterium glaucum]WJZ08593.1 putative enoyl-CoA hydratase echA6 [Corynebacterium glaucum]